MYWIHNHVSQKAHCKSVYGEWRATDSIHYLVLHFNFTSLQYFPINLWFYFWAI